MSDQDGRKKICFGFSKKLSSATLNKSGVASVPLPVKHEKIEFIESVEGKEFKTIGTPKEEEKQELVIPLKDSIPKWQKKLLSQRAERLSLKDDSSIKKETLDDLAVQELIKDAETAMQEKDDERKVHTIPLAEEDDVEEDKEEPTLDNYASVPVADFGLAMLRGMGWTPGKGIGKNPQVVTPRELNIRPRGMGLGAERPNTTKPGQEDLKLVKGSYVKISQGPLKGCYAQVESFDDSCGRVVVKMALGEKSQSVCEYMVDVVTSKDFKENSKQITTENADLVRRSTSTVGKTSESRNGNPKSSKTYGLVKRQRSRSPVNRR